MQRATLAAARRYIKHRNLTIQGSKVLVPVADGILPSSTEKSSNKRFYKITLKDLCQYYANHIKAFDEADRKTKRAQTLARLNKVKEPLQIQTEKI